MNLHSLPSERIYRKFTQDEKSAIVNILTTFPGKYKFKTEGQNLLIQMGTVWEPFWAETIRSWSNGGAFADSFREAMLTTGE